MPQRTSTTNPSSLEVLVEGGASKTENEEVIPQASDSTAHLKRCRSPLSRTNVVDFPLAMRKCRLTRGVSMNR
ncbi:unnamed protein product [Ectocarpus sp. CCAP 1310/34]|nr:unnamed protein product [Ectocarpus sp. CCAP 1310/34]